MHAFALSLPAVQFTRTYGSAQISRCERSKARLVRACMHACSALYTCPGEYPYCRQWTDQHTIQVTPTGCGGAAKILLRRVEVPAETCFRPACFLIAWLNLVARKICVWVTVGDQRLVFLTIECICCTFLDFGCNAWRFDNYRSRKAKSAAGTYGALQHCKTPGRNLSFTNISEPMHAPRYRWNYKNNACMFFPQHSLSH